MAFLLENLNREHPKPVEPECICSYLSQRWPMLLLDRIIDHEPGEWAIGTHAVSRNEPFFPGHYPDNPIMPGTMMLEAMSQTATFTLISAGMAGGEQGRVLFAGADKLRFFLPVKPGDTIVFYCTLDDDRMGIYKFSGSGKVKDEMCISAVMTFTVAR